jgi:uncharacterized membrane protein YphA (DoxX/SURF4 family)
MSNFSTTARVLLGLYFVIFGLNGFLRFIPQVPMGIEGDKVFSAIFTPSYQFPLVKGLEIISGLSLLANRYTALALMVLAVISVQIILFQLTYTSIQGSMMQIVFTALLVYLMINRKDQYQGILKK